MSDPARAGQVLTASPGEWLGTPPLTFTYQWEGCGPSGLGCRTIADAASVEYAVHAEDVGMTLRVARTATNAGGTSAPAYSALTGIVGRGQLVSLESPAIFGAARVGQSLTATPGRWNNPGPLDFLYRWLRCEADGSACAASLKGTSPTYAVSPLDAGHRLRVRVPAINDAGSAVADSALIAAIEDPWTLPSAGLSLAARVARLRRSCRRFRSCACMESHAYRSGSATRSR